MLKCVSRDSRYETLYSPKRDLNSDLLSFFLSRVSRGKIIYLNIFFMTFILRCGAISRENITCVSIKLGHIIFFFFLFFL